MAFFDAYTTNLTFILRGYHIVYFLEKTRKPKKTYQMISEQLTSAVVDATTNGVNYLHNFIVNTDGEWYSDQRAGTEYINTVSPPFVAAAGMLALEVCSGDQVNSIVNLSRKFIVTQIVYPGIWRWPNFVYDLDSTAFCSLAVGLNGHPWIFFGKNIRHILSCRNDDDLFVTWTIPNGPFVKFNYADPVVNANVIAYLGDRAETRPAQQWIQCLITKDRELEALVWYESPLDLYYSICRTLRVSAPAFNRLKTPLANRIVNSNPDNPLRAAQALSSLHMLGHVSDEVFIQQCVNSLLNWQQPNGSWPSCELTRTPCGLHTFWSETMVCAYCIEALTRIAKP